MEDEKKVYIGNLEFSVTEEELKQAIEEKGITVKEVKIITDKFSGRSKGFSFVEMSSDEEGEKAIEKFNGHKMEERTIIVNEARPMTDRGSRDSRGGGGFNRGRRDFGQRNRY